MPDTVVVTTTDQCNSSTIQTSTEGTVTTTVTTNCSQGVNETVTNTDDSAFHHSCPCGKMDLDRLSEELLQCSLTSSNIILARSNAIIVFTAIILQEILKTICHSKNFNINTVFLVTSALASLGDGLQINNARPFNS